MGISVVTTKRREEGNGVKTKFDFPFAIFEQTDIKVYKVVRATDALGSVLTLGSDYTVAFTSGKENTGSVTFAVAPTNEQDSFIVSSLPATQTVSLPINSKFREDQIESMGNRLVRIIQELKEVAARTLKLPITAEEDAEFPSPESNKFLGWDALGENIVNKELPDPSTLEKASQADAEAGVNNDKFMTPLRTAQATADKITMGKAIAAAIVFG
jgi:hypothetical protein